MSLKFERITSRDRLESLHNEWNGLLPTNPTNEVFLTWEWQTTWWESYLPGDLWVIAARDESGALVGIAPWFREAESLVIRPIGCVEVTDYLDIFVRPEHRSAFLSGLADLLYECRDEYSRVNLCNNPGRSPTNEDLPRILTERGFTVNVRVQEVCPTIALPTDFETYLNGLDKKNRHECRRKMRRAEENDPKVEWYIVGPNHDLQAEIEQFIKLMAASHPEKTQFLDDPKNAAFFRAVMPKIAACGWLHLCVLTVGGNAAAAYLNFDYNNRIMVYNSGLIPETYSYLSPGIVLLLYMIQHAIGQRRTEFDFLRGNEDYKYRMGGQDYPVREIQIYK